MPRASKFNMPIASPASAAAVTMPLNDVIAAIMTMHDNGTVVRPTNLPVGAIWASSLAGQITVFHYVGNDVDVPIWIINNGIALSTASVSRAGMLRIGTEAEHLAGLSTSVAAVPGRIQKMIDQKAAELQAKMGEMLPTPTEADQGASLIVGDDLTWKADQLEQRLVNRINQILPPITPMDANKFLQVSAAPGLSLYWAEVKIPSFFEREATIVQSTTWVTPAPGLYNITSYGGAGGGGGGGGGIWKSDKVWYGGYGGGGTSGDVRNTVISLNQGVSITVVIGAGGTGGGGGGGGHMDDLIDISKGGGGGSVGGSAGGVGWPGGAPNKATKTGGGGGGGGRGGTTTVTISGSVILTAFGGNGGGGGAGAWSQKASWSYANAGKTAAAGGAGGAGMASENPELGRGGQGGTGGFVGTGAGGGGGTVSQYSGGNGASGTPGKVVILY